MKRIPKLQKLKTEIIALENIEAEKLLDWLQAVTDVRREEIKRSEAKKEGNQK